LLTFRAIAATLVTLQIALFFIGWGFRLGVVWFGADFLTRGYPVLYAAVGVMVLGAAWLAGVAGVRAAYEPSPRLVLVCAIAAAVAVALWTFYAPRLGREPVWFHVLIPAEVLVMALWSGERALARRAEEEEPELADQK
jgi:hypothetical protein